MKLPLTGGCFCGKVRYEILAHPLRMGFCHCRSCQQATGSAFFPFIAISENALSIQGELTWYESIGDTGHKVHRSFCPICGSRLFSKPDAIPNLRTVSASSLDNPHAFKPEIAVWVEEAVPWHDVSTDLTQFNKNSAAFQK